MAHQLKLYLDESLSKSLKEFNFPRTDVGEESYIDFYIHNSSEKWPLSEISYEKNDEFKVRNIPQTVPAGKSIKCTAVYSPGINTDDPLSFMPKFEGDLLIG